MMTQNRNSKEGSLGRKLHKFLHRQLPLGKTLGSEKSLSFTGLVLFAVVFSVIAILVMMDSVNRTKKRSG
ncbi:MAG: hypothetical protein AB2746_12935, partial [Candidatus Thiodiazotropha taylori]